MWSNAVLFEFVETAVIKHVTPEIVPPFEAISFEIIAQAAR